MKNKIYLITYTSNDQWEISSGILVVCAETKAKAKKLAIEKKGLS